MTGLEKIKQEILNEARLSAESRRKAAEAEASELMEEARGKAEAEADAIWRRAEAEVANSRERTISSCGLLRRKAILAAKQALIAETLDKAYWTLCQADNAAYFGFIKKMVGQYAQPLQGEICFSEADLNRIPEEFEQEIQNIARIKGGELVLSQKGRAIEGGGFLLIYGDVEENCTFKALLDAKHDELTDQINRILFA